MFAAEPEPPSWLTPGDRVQESTLPIPLSAAQIADEIANRIHRGTYPRGTRLPTHQAFALEFNCGMTTITNAMRMLRQEGLVVGVQGLGVYVAEDDT